MDAVVPDWVTFAAGMPIAFAQVREDSLLDVEILERIGGRQIRGIMIASGGCTAAALVASGRLTELHLVDMNPAQLALSRLKLDLLHTAMPQERAEILGHAPLSINERSARLGEALRRLELPPDVLGPPSFVAEVGPDQAGRYELLFAQLRHEIRGFTSEIVDLLNLDDTAERIRRTRPEAPLGRAIDEAFEHGMALPHLVRLFGAQATQNSLESFAKHFARRTRQAIALGCTVDNPYLWQLLTGKFPNGVTTPWMSAMPPHPPARSDRIPLHIRYGAGMFLRPVRFRSPVQYSRLARSRSGSPDVAACQLCFAAGWVCAHPAIELSARYPFARPIL